MAFVKAGPSFPAMTVAEKPSLLSSFKRFRRFSVQFATMRRFLQLGSSARFRSRLASGAMVRKAGPNGITRLDQSSAAFVRLLSEWLHIGDDTHGALQAEAAAEAGHGGREAD